MPPVQIKPMKKIYNITADNKLRHMRWSKKEIFHFRFSHRKIRNGFIANIYLHILVWFRSRRRVLMSLQCVLILFPTLPPANTHTQWWFCTNRMSSLVSCPLSILNEENRLSYTHKIKKEERNQWLNHNNSTQRKNLESIHRDFALLNRFGATPYMCTYAFVSQKD